MYIIENLSHFVISWLLLKKKLLKIRHVFTIQGEIHTVKGDNQQFFLKIMSLFRLGKTLTFCNTRMSDITEDIYLKIGICIYYPRAMHAIKGDNSKLILKNNPPFSTETFYSLSNTPQHSALSFLI